MILSGRRHEADFRRQRSHPAPEREVHRLGDHQQQPGHHLL